MTSYSTADLIRNPILSLILNRNSLIVSYIKIDSLLILRSALKGEKDVHLDCTIY